MTDFSKQTEMKARFDKFDIHSVSMSGGQYSPSISITTRASDVVTLVFQTTDELHNFINMVITAGLKMNWGKDYSSAHVYAGEIQDELVTTEQVITWREYHTQNNKIETVIEPNA